MDDREYPRSWGLSPVRLLQPYRDRLDRGGVTHGWSCIMKNIGGIEPCSLATVVSLPLTSWGCNPWMIVYTGRGGKPVAILLYHSRVSVLRLVQRLRSLSVLRTCRVSRLGGGSGRTRSRRILTLLYVRGVNQRMQYRKCTTPPAHTAHAFCCFVASLLCLFVLFVS